MAPYWFLCELAKVIYAEYLTWRTYIISLVSQSGEFNPKKWSISDRLVVVIEIWTSLIRVSRADPPSLTDWRRWAENWSLPYYSRFMFLFCSDLSDCAHWAFHRSAYGASPKPVNYFAISNSKKFILAAFCFRLCCNCSNASASRLAPITNYDEHSLMAMVSEKPGQ